MMGMFALNKIFTEEFHWSIFNLSLQYPYIVKETGYENKENHQLVDTVLMYHRILITLKEMHGDQLGDLIFWYEFSHHSLCWRVRQLVPVLFPFLGFLICFLFQSVQLLEQPWTLVIWKLCHITIATSHAAAIGLLHRGMKITAFIIFCYKYQQSYRPSVALLVAQS